MQIVDGTKHDTRSKLRETENRAIMRYTSNQCGDLKSRGLSLSNIVNDYLTLVTNRRWLEIRDERQGSMNAIRAFRSSKFHRHTSFHNFDQFKCPDHYEFELNLKDCLIDNGVISSCRSCLLMKKAEITSDG